MANKEPNIEALAKYKAKKNKERHDSVVKVIEQTLNSNKTISLSSIAKEAGVSRNFIYCSQPLRKLIDDNRQAALVRYNSSTERVKEYALNRSLKNKLKTIVEKSSQQAIEITSLKEKNQKLRVHIEQLTQTKNH